MASAQPFTLVPTEEDEVQSLSVSCPELVRHLSPNLAEKVMPEWNGNKRAICIVVSPDRKFLKLVYRKDLGDVWLPSVEVNGDHYPQRLVEMLRISSRNKLLVGHDDLKPLGHRVFITEHRNIAVFFYACIVKTQGKMYWCGHESEWYPYSEDLLKWPPHGVRLEDSFRGILLDFWPHIRSCEF